MKKIIIVGAGFVGINFLQKIIKQNKSKYQITLFDRNNHHVFQPMLYQAATAFIPINNVIHPIRKLLYKSNVIFNMEKVVGIIPDKQIVKTANNFYKYDYLVVATGVEYDYFGNDHWKKYVLSLKTANDAMQIKTHILRQFELAEIAKTEEEKRKALTFIIIGAGATGVEITGAILDLIYTDFFTTYKNFSKDDISIYLIDGGDTILSAFPKKLSDIAYKSLKERNVNICLNEAVIDITSNCVHTKKDTYTGSTIIWSAMLKGRAIGEWMSNEINKGKVEVLNNLTHPTYQNIYFAGDISYIKDNPLPGLASVAKQQGKFIAKDIIRKDNNKPSRDFKYKDLGTMAIIKRHDAIANIFGINLKGKLGWFVWGGAHITFLISMRNKLIVSLNWLSYYIFKRIGSIEFIKNDDEKKK